jgi:uncharacterized protein with FMN-binding domain
MKKTVVTFSVVLIIGFLVMLQKIDFANLDRDDDIQIPVGSASKETINSVTPTTATPTQVNTQLAGGQYKDGSYTGKTTDAFYGDFQVKAIVSGGKITDIEFLKFPNDRDTSIEINTQSMPILKQEAIASQNANVDIITGATQSSIAFRESLQSALDQAL